MASRAVRRVYLCLLDARNGLGMAELVDAVVLGTIRKFPVQVQVLLPVRKGFTFLKTHL